MRTRRIAGRLIFLVLKRRRKKGNYDVRKKRNYLRRIGTDCKPLGECGIFLQGYGVLKLPT
jgi:hypothetical protein